MKETKASSSNRNIRLNKYIANSGVCSRRNADKLIEQGRIKVNGKTVSELGFKVSRQDSVLLDGKPLSGEKPVYILLNKPKGFITTTKDTHDRKIVMDLIKHATDQRVYPVGRLDKDTLGLLLFTNDGELANKLTHPSTNISKIYKVELDRPITKNDLNTLSEGITLEDGFIRPDAAAMDPEQRNAVGIEIHSGKNRIVRRMFEHLGYRIQKLDRVVFAGLTKKNLPRGKWRILQEKEIRNLKKRCNLR